MGGWIEQELSWRGRGREAREEARRDATKISRPLTTIDPLVEARAKISESGCALGPFDPCAVEHEPSES